MPRVLPDFIVRPVRSLRRSPAYALTSIVSVAIGLALASTTWAFIESLRNPPSPFPNQPRIFTQRLRYGTTKDPPSVGERIRMLREMPGVEDVAVRRYGGLGEVQLTNFEYSSAQAISTNYFRLHGIAPRLGRFPREEDADATPSVIVTDEIWRKEFGNSPSLDRARVRVGDRFLPVSAVLPEDINGRGFGAVYVPMAKNIGADTLRESSYRGSTSVLVLLKDGVTKTALAPQLELMGRNLTAKYVRGNEPPFVAQLDGGTRPFRLDASNALMYLLGFGILAIGCANVAALTLARGLRSRRDYALRMALGASRSHIAAQVLGEVLLVTIVGAALGIGLANGLLGLMRLVTPIELVWEGLGIPQLDAVVFISCAVAMVFAIAIGGAYPAFRASRIAPNEPLKDGAGTTTGRSKSEFRVLLIAELAIAMVLLMMASLEIVSLKNVLTYDFGFEPRTIAVASVRAGAGREKFTPAELMAHKRRSVEVLLAVPGVRAAAMSGGYAPIPDKTISSDRSAAGEPMLTSRGYFTAGPGYFTAMGVEITQGRDFEPGDTQGKGAAILSSLAASKLFPHGNALGRRVKLGTPSRPGEWVTVVGVSEDFTERPMADPEDRDPPVYFAAPDTGWQYWNVIARADSTPAALIRPARAALVDALPPNSRIGVRALSESFERPIRYMSFFVRMFGALGLAALALSALGIFSVMSYVVGQRSREFAVRVSLGATPTNLMRVVMRSTLEFALGGTAFGALLSFWASAGMSGMLFGVKNTDPVSLVIAEATLIVACLLAALAPALRASRANPLDIIRAV